MVFARYASIVLSEVFATSPADGGTVFVEAEATYIDRADASHSIPSV